MKDTVLFLVFFWLKTQYQIMMHDCIDVELHLFSRYARGLAETIVTSHVTSVRPDVTAVQGAHTRCARIKLRSP
jgi:hypothetical protein